MTDYLLVVAGLALLITGGELLVRGASTVAQRLGMSPLLIGLTLVGFGTSTPELVTSIEASLAGSPGIAVGNIVGSNIANILFILGIAAVITPVAVSQNALRRDGSFVLITAAAFCLVGTFASLDRLVGVVFVAGLASYIYYAYRQETAGAPDGHTAAFEKLEAHEEVFDSHLGGSTTTTKPAVSAATSGLAWPLGLAVLGLLLVVGGGKLLVDGATGIARSAGVSETLIGLTIVAVGTSLPELVTSVIAALRRHADVALGNVLGSNIYNILGIGGVTALIAPTTIPPEIVRFDSLVMLVVSGLLLVVARTGYTIGRLEGCILIGAYAVYLAALWPA
jgi:cation:H+ antiporter